MTSKMVATPLVSTGNMVGAEAWLHLTAMEWLQRDRGSVRKVSSPSVSPLHVFRVVLQTRDELCHRMAIKADLVNGGEKRKPAEGRQTRVITG